MATKTLTEVSSFGLQGAPPVKADIFTKDELGNRMTVLVQFVGTLIMNFVGWSSNATVDSESHSGNYNGTGLPTSVSMSYHGTGNLTGHGNDDAYSGTFSCTDIRYTSDAPHIPTFFGATWSVTYTD